MSEFGLAIVPLASIFMRDSSVATPEHKSMHSCRVIFVQNTATSLHVYVYLHPNFSHHHRIASHHEVSSHPQKQGSIYIYQGLPSQISAPISTSLQALRFDIDMLACSNWTPKDFETSFTRLHKLASCRLGGSAPNHRFKPTRLGAW
ncbi:hypothetical protein AB1N83_012320 [Pleurotus pulmonarius]